MPPRRAYPNEHTTVHAKDRQPVGSHGDPAGHTAPGPRVDDVTAGDGARKCEHRRTQHKHDTRAAYVLDRCRCILCTAANTAAGRERAKAIAYGRWNPYVDAAPARAHVCALVAGGLTLRRIAVLSHVGYGALSKLLYGSPSRGRPPSQRIRPDTEQKLLALAIPAGSAIAMPCSRNSGIAARCAGDVIWSGTSGQGSEERLCLR